VDKLNPTCSTSNHTAAIREDQKLYTDTVRFISSLVYSKQSKSNTFLKKPAWQIHFYRIERCKLFSRLYRTIKKCAIFPYRVAQKSLGTGFQLTFIEYQVTFAPLCIIGNTFSPQPPEPTTVAVETGVITSPETSINHYPT